MNDMVDPNEVEIEGALEYDDEGHNRSLNRQTDNMADFGKAEDEQYGEEGIP